MPYFFTIVNIAYKSLIYRKGAVIMAILSVAMSVFVLLGIEHIRHETRQHFTNTVSGVDLIAGPRTGQINLLLYSVFRIGNPTNNITWKSAQAIKQHPQVRWTIPLSLGDSHNGFRVVGTNDDFFKHFRYGQQQPLSWLHGNAFEQVSDVVLGSQVAAALNYTVGDQLILAHGIAQTSFTLHNNHPFNVVGILKPTNTPVDNALYVKLEGIEAIHQSGDTQKANLTPEYITAIMVGLNKKLATFSMQRWINDYPNEALMAILPGVTLMELWQTMGHIEKILTIISSLVFVAALFGITAMLLSSMREREQELLILRALGASPWMNYWLLTCEALLILIVGAILAIALLMIAITIANYFFSTFTGMYFSLNIITLSSSIALLVMLLSVFPMSLFPAIKAYKITKVS